MTVLSTRGSGRLGRSVVLVCGVLTATCIRAYAQPADTSSFVLEPSPPATMDDRAGVRTWGLRVDHVPATMIESGRGALTDGGRAAPGDTQLAAAADPLWDGTLIGLGTGFAGGCIAGYATYDHPEVLIKDAGHACLFDGLFSGGIGAGVGALIDWAFGRRHASLSTAPRANLSVRPAVRGRRTAVVAAVRW